MSFCIPNKAMGLPKGASLVKHADEGREIGLGIEFTHDGRFCRTAVLLPRNPSENDIFEAWDLLNTAVRSPSPETCVFGEEFLRGREQRVSSLKSPTTA